MSRSTDPRVDLERGRAPRPRPGRWRAPARRGARASSAWRPPLPRAFYDRPAASVARDLLGCVLVHRIAGEPLLAGRIVETEAYVGEADRASHARNGRTARNAPMYGPPGYAYVYFVYGMHDMLNVVCQPPGRPEAVLLRALSPLAGLDAMRRRRGGGRDRDLARGPARLCAALAVTRAHNGADLCRGRLWIAPGALAPGERVRRGPRIGVAYAGADARRWLRFYVDGDPHVSRAPPRRQARKRPARDRLTQRPLSQRAGAGRARGQVPHPEPEGVVAPKLKHIRL